MVFFPYGLCFAEYTVLTDKYFIANFVIVTDVFLFLLSLLQSVMLCLNSPIYFQSAMNSTSKSMSRPKIAAPGEAFNTVWYVEGIAHAALPMNVSMSAGSTDSVMSISEVRIIVPGT
jgi:hypothetical protein